MTAPEELTAEDRAELCRRIEDTLQRATGDRLQHLLDLLELALELAAADATKSTKGVPATSVREGQAGG